jgi:hypothetical protein
MQRLSSKRRHNTGVDLPIPSRSRAPLPAHPFGVQVWTKSPRSQTRVQRSEFLYPKRRLRLAEAPNLRSLRATPAHPFGVRVWETGKLTADEAFHGQEEAPDKQLPAG